MIPQHVVIVVPPGGRVDLFAAADAPAKRWFRNRGPGDATFATGADATAASIKLPAGQRHDPPYRTGLRVSVFSAAGTTIEGEQWS